mmetsp:Transcript_2998/g.7251  ORF Transcript_2998/g.7251 Transcript_2998/m.7251 type:complete len:83 (+) Transcript_2998:381-629(+)
MLSRINLYLLGFLAQMVFTYVQIEFQRVMERSSLPGPALNFVKAVNKVRAFSSSDMAKMLSKVEKNILSDASLLPRWPSLNN